MFLPLVLGVQACVGHHCAVAVVLSHTLLSICQAWSENKEPALAPGEMPKERKDEKKADGKKKTQSEIEQEMAALQYSNPMLLEVRSLSSAHMVSHTHTIFKYLANDK